MKHLITNVDIGSVAYDAGCCVAPDEGEGVGVKTDCVAKAVGVTDANTLGTAEAAFLSV